MLFSDSPKEGGVSKDLFKNSSFRLVLGIVTAVVGLLKFLSVVPGNYPVVGDILPALGGLAAGAMLIYEFYKEHATITNPSVEKVSVFASARQRIVAGVSIATAVLHFLFPTALFL
ncbi:MAG: hypothetical protein LBK61_01330 [Spirochaetaceae bacterium]|nr:hypothetical protein [Spirochaetaceae bacterium]